MSLVDTRDLEKRIADRVDQGVTGKMTLATNRTGGLTFSTMSEVMEFAKLMAVSGIGVRKHLRGNPGACLSICVQAIEWQMSPFAVASKSYLVNDQVAFEAQLINAVILRRAPIRGRLKYEYTGTGAARKCKVSARLRDEDDEWAEYESPEFKDIQPKNSPLWKTDPDQQLGYYSSRALCRRHFPDILLGVYDVDELVAEDKAPQPGGPKDVTPSHDRIKSQFDALANEGAAEVSGEHDDSREAARSPTGPVTIDGDTGEILDGTATTTTESSGDDRKSSETPSDDLGRSDGEQGAGASTSSQTAPASTSQAEPAKGKAKDDDKRAAKLAALLEVGDKVAAREGYPGVKDWIEDLSGSQVALIIPDHHDRWKSVAKEAGKPVD